MQKQGAPLPPGGVSKRPAELLDETTSAAKTPGGKSWGLRKFPVAGARPVGQPPEDVNLVGSEDEAAQMSGNNLASEISVDQVDPSPFQPRIQFDEGELEELAGSLNAIALTNPIIVRQKADGRFELVGGERRWRAYQLLEKTTIPAVIKELDDGQAAILAVTDNTARKDLTDYEKGKSFFRLLNDPLASTGKPAVKTASELARLIALPYSTVSRCLDFMKLPAPVLSLLEMIPDLFGGNTAEAFSGFAKTHPDLVIEAANRMRDNDMTQQAALTWLKGQITQANKSAGNPNANPVKTMPIVNAGRRMCDARIQGRKVVLDCAEGIDPERLLAIVSELLSKEAQEGSEG